MNGHHCTADGVQAAVGGKRTYPPPVVIVVSLQFTRDWAAPQLGQLCELLERFFKEVSLCVASVPCRVLLKHHPRFNNAVDLIGVEQRYPFAEFTARSLDELAHEAHWHVTLHSTAAFEFAAFGVPTFFWLTDDFPLVKQIFFEEYEYTLQPADMVEAIQMVELEPARYASVREAVKVWHRRFYAPFDEVAAAAALMPGFGFEKRC